MCGKEMEKIDLALRDFRAYSEDLISSRNHNFRNNLKIFVDFCETNEVMKKIVKPLKNNTRININDWWYNLSKTGGSFVGSKHYEVPSNDEDRAALFYQFIIALNEEKLSFDTFAVWVYGHSNFDDNVITFNQDITKKLIRYLNFRLEETKKNTKVQSDEEGLEWDLFICHASEDKDSIVRELATKLDENGFKVWYDEFTLKLGDSLRQKIDYGLAHSRYGIVVLSVDFFKKEWPQKELDGLVAREGKKTKVILPIWHGVTIEDVKKFSPILAGRIAVSTHKGLDYVVGEIIRAIK